MALVDPLPFRLPVSGEETLDWRGVRSVSYRVEGLLHLENNYLVFEWSGTRNVEKVGVSGVVDKKDQLPHEALDVSVNWITEVRLRGGWWAPRFHLRARRLNAFDPMPSARPGAIKLKVRRRDRALAQEMGVAIELAMAEARLAETEDMLHLDEDALQQLRGGDEDEDVTGESITS